MPEKQWHSSQKFMHRKRMLILNSYLEVNEIGSNSMAGARAMGNCTIITGKFDKKALRVCGWVYDVHKWPRKKLHFVRKLAIWKWINVGILSLMLFYLIVRIHVVVLQEVAGLLQGCEDVRKSFEVVFMRKRWIAKGKESTMIFWP